MIPTHTFAESQVTESQPKYEIEIEVLNDAVGQGTAFSSARKLADALRSVIARTLIRREPHNVMHVVALAEAVGHREGPAASAAVYEFGVEEFPDFPMLRVSLAVELVNAGQMEEAKRVVKIACELDPDLKLVVLDHPGLEGIW